jgi:hypothetical protein
VYGKNGTYYGKGAYFARDAEYSHNYTGNKSKKTMFLAKVLIGKITKGDSSFQRPPAIDPMNPHLLYDTCVDNIHKPSIYVVFDNAQSYPLYQITYKENQILLQTTTSSPTSPYYGTATNVRTNATNVRDAANGNQKKDDSCVLL